MVAQVVEQGIFSGRVWSAAGLFDSDATITAQLRSKIGTAVGVYGPISLRSNKGKGVQDINLIYEVESSK